MVYNALALIVFYRMSKLLRKIRNVLRKRVIILLVVFTVSWLFSSALFYYTEHILYGREDVDIWISLYWAIITMATVGYGDIIPESSSGKIVAAMASIFGIMVYTLFISTIADYFLEITMKASLGLGRLKEKSIIVVGEGPVCEETIRELVANGFREEIGWIREHTPRGEALVDFIVGELSLETLKRGGVEQADSIIVCYEDDSKNIHVAALARRLNRRAKIVSLAREETTEHILETIGAENIIPIAILGRLLASSSFEPNVARFLSRITTARYDVDVAEIKLDKTQSLREFESKTGYKVLAVVKNSKLEVVDGKSSDLTLEEGARIIVIKKK